MSQKTVTVSVRRLVEFILRSGDIDTVSGAFGEMDAMQQGGLMHRKLQKEAGPSYRAEVSLKHTTEMDETLAITVEGRADGVITETEMAADESGELELKEVVTIDEIKGTYRNLRYITEPVLVHLAQAKCYAYIYGQQHGQMRMGVRMIYADLETEELRYFEETYTMEELSGWFRDLMTEYGKWVSFESLWQERRAESLNFRSFGKKSDRRRSERSVFHFLTGKGRRIWQSVSTGRSQERRGCLSRLRRVWERHFRFCFQR